MVPSVEIYDPRVGTWIVGEPMNQSRGYSAAAVLKESIYVIGGVQSNEEIVDVVCNLISLFISCLVSYCSWWQTLMCYGCRLNVTRRVKVGKCLA